MKPHYYYKTWEKSVIGQNLQSFIEKCAEASETARLWAKAHGATTYIESPQGMAGGIYALEGLTSPSADWEEITSIKGDKFFLPKEGTALDKEMHNLPIVSEANLIPILQFKPRISSKGVPMPVTFGNTTPTIFLHRGWWYFDAPYECEAEALTLITRHEYDTHLLSAQSL